MSLLDTPLALIDRMLARRAPSVAADDPAARLIERTTARLRPNARFRHQLRTTVINRYVAEREGLVPIAPRRREMGTLGRAVLVATFALVVGVSSVGAASMGSLPGDALYGVKLRLEAVRMEIAPPSVRPMLAAMALDERLSELEKLAEAGRWDEIPAASAAVAGAQATAAAYGVTAGSADASGADLARHAAVLEQLLGIAPDAAKPGLERALAASTGQTDPSTAPGQAGQGQAGQGQAGQGQGNGQQGNGQQGNGQAGPASPKPTPRATSSTKP
jgi:hypothetical protein